MNDPSFEEDSEDMHLIAKTDLPKKVKAVKSREKTAKLYMAGKLEGTSGM